MKKIIFITLCLFLASTVAWADWDYDPKDPYNKWIQLPDPIGWDVNATSPAVVADDWLCTERSPIAHIHLWGSWLGDQRAPIRNIHVSIHADIPVGPDIPYSRPGDLLWQRDFGPQQFKVRPYGQGEQGWIWEPNEYQYPDHFEFHQINITGIRDPFIQKGSPDRPMIYWLDISVTLDPDFPNALWGWKTSKDHWNDDAVWARVPDTGGPLEWQELRDPTGESLDMAFVLATPIPGAVWLLGTGLIALIGIRRKSRS
jgi:hypothetical protein